jgi:CheY-like chemotaxis protein
MYGIHEKVPSLWFPRAIRDFVIIVINLLFELLLLYQPWYSNIETKSISLYQLEKPGLEGVSSESNKWHILNTQQKNEIFAELQEQAQQKREHNISSYKVNENTQISEQRARSKRTVLICDDEKDLLFMFTIALQESYDVLTAKSGEECIKLYLDAKRSGRKIDLILLDYRLGDATGYDVAHKIKELNDVKIIMITAFHVDHHIIRELEDNELVIDIVQKPIDIDSLTAKIAQCTES